MPSWIIRSRVEASAPAGRRLVRSRLVASFFGDGACRVIVVLAPGGYGKSSLLIDAFHEVGIKPAWYGVHEHERDVLAFLSYLVESLHVAYPTLIRHVHDACASGQAPPAQLVGMLLNEIGEFGDDVHLVLDDLHRAIGEPAVAEVVRTMVEAAPANLRLHLLTREPLPFPLARLRAAGRARVLGVRHLAFTPEEVAVLFEEVWGQRLREDQVELLIRKSGGWIAALVLMHLAGDPSDESALQRVLDSPNTDDEMLFSYLSEEILHTQSPEVQHFLKETSILEQFDADSAGHVTGTTGPASLIAEIEQRTLFLVPVDGQHHTFRYHHLFEAFLRRVLRDESGIQGWRERQRRAADWFEDRDPRMAIAHSIEASDFERAARLITMHGPAYLQRGWSHHVAEWLGALPTVVVESSPRLLHIAGGMEEQRGDWVAALQRFRPAMEAFRLIGDRAGLAEVMEASALCLGKYGDWARMKDFVAEAHACCPRDDVGLRARILAWEGSNLTLLGEDLSHARRCLEEAYAAAHRSSEPEAIAAACFSYGFVGHLLNGDFDAGVRVMQEGIELFRRLRNPYVVLHMQVNQAVLLTYAGRLDEAQEKLLAPEVSDLAGIPFASLAQRLTLGMTALERGDLETCQTSLEGLPEGAVPLQLRPWYLRTLALMRARQLNRALAASTVREMFEALRHQGGRGLYAPECHIAAAAIKTWLGELDEAREQAQLALDIADAAVMPYWRMKSRAWLAWIAASAADDAGALDHVEQALRHTRDGAYHAFWQNDFGGFTVPLLVRAIVASREAREAEEILARCGSRAHAELGRILQSDRPDREKEVVCRLLGDVGAVAQATLLTGARRRGSAGQRQAARVALEKLAAAASSVEIRTLGGFEIRRNGETVTLPNRTPRSITLLKVLLSSPAQTVLVDALIESMWPDSPLDKARKNLRMQTLHLRDLLCPERRAGDDAFVLVDGDTYRLETGEALAVDFLAFEAALAEADLARRADERAGAREALKRASELYRGVFLPDDVYMEFTERRRRDLAGRHLRCLVELAEGYLMDDLLEDAMPLYQRALEIERTSERAFQKLLHCYLRLGERAAGARDCKAFVENLWNDLEVEPTDHTQALIDEFLPSARVVDAGQQARCSRQES